MRTPRTKASTQPETLETVLTPAHGMAIIDQADDAIISVGSDQRIILYNHGAERVFGFSRDEALGQSVEFILPERFAQILVGTFPDEVQERREIVGHRKNGEEFPAEASISRTSVNGDRIFTVILRDISDRKEAEAKMRAPLRQKEVVLKEIHHQVKNNLQVVSSLLALQSRMIEDPHTRKMFHESQNRIHSMALVHEQLYRSGDLSEIDYRQYINELSAHLYRTYGVSANRVVLNLDFDEARMALDTAVPCGLILNELLSNSLKHAFPDGRRGEIRVELNMDNGHVASLLVADDGIGLPEDINVSNAKSLGLRLVRILATDMGATVEMGSRSGTETKLIFPQAKRNGSSAT